MQRVNRLQAIEQQILEATGADKIIYRYIPYTLYLIPYTIYHIPYTIYLIPYALLQAVVYITIQMDCYWVQRVQRLQRVERVPRVTKLCASPPMQAAM